MFLAPAEDFHYVELSDPVASDLELLTMEK